MSASKGFQVVSETETAATANDQRRATKLSAEMLALALKALSDRAIASVSNLMTIGMVVSAWFLWRAILDNPTVLQLVGVGSYAMFVLLIDVVRRRK